MQKAYRIVLILIFASLLQVKAEKLQKFFLSFDFGAKGVIADLSDSWPIRQDVSSVDSYTNRSINLHSAMNFFGLSTEYALDNRFSLISGLRFINFNGEAVKDDYQKGGSFFLRFNNTDSQIEYARVMSINDESSFLGIPLELKYTPFNFRFFSLHSKLSAEFAYRVFNKTSIEFKLPEMMVHETSILNDLNQKSNPFYSSVYISIGANLKLSKRFYASIDLFMPALYLTENNSILLSTTSVSGTQLSLIYALNK